MHVQIEKLMHHHMGFFHLIHSSSCRISHILHRSHLFIGPRIQSDRLDPWYMNPEISMKTSATNTQKDAKIPGSPTWISGPAISAGFIALVLQHLVQNNLMLNTFRLLRTSVSRCHFSGDQFRREKIVEPFFGGVSRPLKAECQNFDTLEVNHRLTGVFEEIRDGTFFVESG